MRYLVYILCASSPFWPDFCYLLLGKSIGIHPASHHFSIFLMFSGILGASLGCLEHFFAAKAPMIPPRAPKTPPGNLQDTPRGLPEAPQRRPRRLPEARDSSFHRGQAECAKRLNIIALFPSFLLDNMISKKANMNFTERVCENTQ